MVRIKKTYFWACIALLFSHSTSGQTVSVKLDRDSILIGELVEYTISVIHNSKEHQPEIDWSEVESAIPSEIEIIDTQYGDTTIRKGGIDRLLNYQKMTITSFDSGYYAIKPVDIIIDGKKTRASGEKLYVNSVAIDVERALGGLKDIYSEPFDWMKFIKTWLPIVAGIFLLLWIIRYFMNREPAEKIYIEPEPIPEERDPAHIIAYRALEVLRNKELLKMGKEKEYQSELTDILRVFIEDRFQVAAMEQTTSETVKKLRSAKLPNASLDQVSQLLNMADFVKFAKGHNSYEINLKALDQVKDFVTLHKEHSNG